MDWDVEAVIVESNNTLFIRFEDGVQGTVEFADSFFSGVFEKLKDPKEFRKVQVVDGVVTWPSDLDLAPDAMHDEIQINGRAFFPLSERNDSEYLNSSQANSEYLQESIAQYENSKKFRPTFNGVEVLRRAVDKAIRRKRALGQYAIVAHNGVAEKRDFSLTKKLSKENGSS